MFILEVHRKNIERPGDVWYAHETSRFCQSRREGSLAAIQRYL
jgi:hypothetical protein